MFEVNGCKRVILCKLNNEIYNVLQDLFTYIQRHNTNYNFYGGSITQEYLRHLTSGKRRSEPHDAVSRINFDAGDLSITTARP